MQDAFDRLGLSPEADAREIRKAYARELKKIDQQNDPDGFQTLRTAYEAALAGEGGSDLGAAATFPFFTLTPVAPKSEPAPRENANTAWELFQYVISRKANANAATWEATLLATLEEETLVSVESRIWFEGMVVEALAHGWQRGHEHLFTAADRVFSWDRKRQNLAQFQHAGQMLKAALSQQDILRGLPARESEPLRLAIQRLRNPRPLTPDELDYLRAPLHRLKHISPTLTAMLTDGVAFQHALEACDQEATPPSSPTPPRQRSIARIALLIIAAWMVSVLAIGHYSPHKRQPALPTQPPSPYPQ